MVFYPQQYLLHLDEETSLALNTKSVVGFFFFVHLQVYNVTCLQYICIKDTDQAD